MKKFYLIPDNGQKSFYEKAVVTVYNPDFVVLTSYKTDVAAIIDGDFVRLWNDYSATTMKHVNAFRNNYGMEPINKKTWCVLPVNEVNHADYILQIAKGA